MVRVKISGFVEGDEFEKGPGEEKSPDNNRPYNGQLLNSHTFLKQF